MTPCARLSGLLVLALLPLACTPADGGPTPNPDGGTCTATGPGGTACDPNTPDQVFNVDACGNVTGVREACDPGRVCTQRTPTSLATCTLPPGCTRTLDKACNEDDPSAVYYVTSCGAYDGIFRACDPGEVCTIDPTNTNPVCRPPAGCTQTLDKACNEDDLSAVYYVDSCGAYDGIFRACDPGEVCTIDPANTNPVCRPPCFPLHNTIACSADGRGREWINACGVPTGEIVSTCAANQVCESNTCRDVVDPCGTAHATLGCDPADLSATRWYNSCGELTDDVAVDCAASGETCNDGQCVAVCAEPIGSACNNVDAPRFLSGVSLIQETDACGARTSTVLETCADGELCTARDGTPTCLNSMTDTSSPYYLKACSFGMFTDAQTDLYMDCRCRKDIQSDPNSREGSILNCWPVGDAWNQGFRWADGPHLYPIAPTVYGGVLSETQGELFSAMQYTDPSYTGGGLIVAYDYTTGARRIVSGIYADPSSGYTEFGSGYKSQRMVSGVPRETTALNYIEDVELGADGMLYAYGNGTLENVEIVRVHPTTGARTLVWRVEQRNGETSPFGQCYGSRTISSTASGRIPVQYEHRAFAMDPSTGKFYLAFRNPSDGIGVVEIAADGSTCTILSRSWASALPDIGTGFSPQYTSLSGMHVHEGKLYVVHILQEALVAYDLSTGNRTAVSVAGSVGEGDHAMGENNIFWDGSRNLMWVMGQVAPYLGFAVDLTTGDRESPFRVSPGGLLPGEYPVDQGHAGALRNGNYLGHGTAALHPSNPDRMFLVGGSGELYEFEISTGNSWIMSL
ncbi:MAG: hypothetical protein KC668_07655 [Myxococcales bacterium]|nr:hypothetical protein [Myxococcales bacterium]